MFFLNFNQSIFFFLVAQKKKQKIKLKRKKKKKSVFKYFKEGKIMTFDITIQFDRVGAQFFTGETVSGAVVVTTDSATSCKAITVGVRGAVDPKVLATRSQMGVFERLQDDLKPYVMLARSIPLGGGGGLKFPAGTTELPFSFPLVATTTLPNGTPVSLVETYNGVFVCCKYEVKATAQFTFRDQVSPGKEVFVIAPGQSENDVFRVPPRIIRQPTTTTAANSSDSENTNTSNNSNNNNHVVREVVLEHGEGFVFDFTSASSKRSRKAHDIAMPEYHITGSIDKVHIDIDTALSGQIKIERCSVPVTSVEIQLARCESCASETRQDKGREITEVQNIQIGDGDVLRDWDIPVFMKFPRWYTCPAIRTPNLRVDFEISLVVTFEGRTQVSQIVPIHLYRSSKRVVN